MLRLFRKGFSLIELLLVIFIVSLVYFLGFDGLQDTPSEKRVLTPLTLRQIVQKSKTFRRQGTLICTDQCQKCFFRKDIGEPFEPYEGKVAMKHIEAYTLDTHNEIRKLTYGRYNGKKICLLIDFYPNGSLTQTILKDKKNVYFIPAFFGKAEIFSSLSEAKKRWLRDEKALQQVGAFY